MDKFFELIKDVGTAWPVIAFVALLLLAIARFIWRRVGEKRQLSRRAKKNISQHVQKILEQLDRVNVSRARLRATQLEFASKYAKLQEAERDTLVQDWHRLQARYQSEVQELTQSFDSTATSEADTQPELRRAWEVELSQLRKLADDASARGAFGPFSDSAGPSWESVIVSVEAYAGRSGLQIKRAKELEKGSASS